MHDGFVSLLMIMFQALMIVRMFRMLTEHEDPELSCRVQCLDMKSTVCMFFLSVDCYQTVCSCFPEYQGHYVQVLNIIIIFKFPEYQGH